MRIGVAQARSVRKDRPRRVFWPTLVVALFALLAVGVTSAPAQAHATLDGTDPTRGSIVDPAPTVLTLNFSERVVPVDKRIKVIGPDGKDVVDGTPTSAGDGARLRIPVAKSLADGTYLVSYRVISADGHPIAGSYTFSVRVPSALGANASNGAGSESAAVNGGVRAVQSASRYAAYAGVALLAGPLVILLGLWPRRLRPTGPRRLAWLGWALLTGGTLGTLILQQPYASGGTLTDVSFSGVGETMDGTVGRALLARVGLLVAAVPVLIRVLRTAVPGQDEPRWAEPVDKGLTGLFGVAVLITFPFAGHAGQSPAPLISVPAITLHVGAMAVWLGGLAVLARYLLPRARYRELEVILPVWSRWAFWAVGALVFSGVIETFLEIGGFGGLDRLINTVYGQLVLTKVIWLGAIMVVASNARSWVRRRFGAPVAYALAADDRSDKDAVVTADDKPRKASASHERKAGGRKAAETRGATANHDVADFSAAGKAAEEIRRLRTRIAIEVLLGAVVLALATALVQVAPARSDGSAGSRLPYSQQVTTGSFTLQIDLSPANVGSNELHLTAFDAQGLPIRVLEWSATADMDSKALTVEIPLQPLTENHAVGQADLPFTGAWKFRFTARISDFERKTITQTITVR